MTDNGDDRLVRDFEFWSVYIAKNQILPGKCVVWCKRQDALDPVDATPAEWAELHAIFTALKGSVKALYGADWFNYTLLGNSTPHLHAHFVPRYKDKLVVNGTEFFDKDWGHEYKVDPGFSIPAETLQFIKYELSEKLNELLNAGHSPRA